MVSPQLLQSYFLHGRLAKTHDYRNAFPRTVLDRNKTNVENWGLTKGGEYIAAGVGTGIGGRGADILIIDDPIKDATEADSATIRTSVLNWYKSTAYTRLSPKGGVLIIMTRWHDDDLAGALEAEEKEMVKDAEEFLDSELEILHDKYNGNRSLIPPAEITACYDERDRLLKDIDRWEIVKYEAIAEHDEYRLSDGRIVNVEEPGSVLLRKGGGIKNGGEALHPERWPRNRLMRIYNNYKRRNIRFWHALYQQTPVPAEGIVFKTDDIQQREVPPDYVWRKWTILQAWDLAIGLKQRNNYTVGLTGAIDPFSNLWILNMVRGKWDTEAIISMILDQYMRYKPFRIGIERGHLEMVIAPSIRKEIRKRNSELQPGQSRYAPVFLQGKEALVPNQDKLLRARPVQGLMQAGAVFFAAGSPWVDTIVAELIRFPSGVLDDTVDALAWLGKMALEAPVPRAELKLELDKWKEKHGWRAKLARERLASRRANFMEA
jgi:predicted phage terminase large subunit-like protein